MDACHKGLALAASSPEYMGATDHGINSRRQLAILHVFLGDACVL